MSSHPHDREATETLARLRSALAGHGITLPSLDLHLPSYASSHGPAPLISPGNCNTATARALADALSPR
ncbi:hypothetical protein ACF059_20075 [Streptomyces sp. NPDC016562]|uniref:hypothetical protein n=1 Tax=Streptomyces sp. NPDC016562 TaxID=3364966 RepID=UPI0036F7C18C